jgi:hypothetical protein
VVTAWERGDAVALRTAVNRVDAAVADGLRAVRLPRGTVVGVEVRPVGRLWLGRKEPTCYLHFDADLLRRAVRDQRAPDDVFKTWVHESIHGRQPFALGDAAQHRRTRGYEEGIVEGLARVVTRDRAGMSIADAAYDYYVTAYQSLADVLDAPVEHVWRRLWTHPLGGVRAAFVEEAGAVLADSSGQRLTAAQRIRLLGLGDQAFSSGRERAANPDPVALRAFWGMMFR